MNLNDPLVYLTLVIVLGVATQWVALRLGMPAILLLLIAGFGLGQFIDPEQVLSQDLLFAVISLSVAIILFDGGLKLKIRDLEEAASVVVRLCTVGLAVTWALSTIAGRLVFDEWEVALLTGAIYTVTGPTVIGPLLRQIRPKRRVGSIARWEGIVIDPIGAVLAVLVFEAITVSRAQGFEMVFSAVGSSLLRTIAVGVALGVGAAALVILLMRRRWVPDYLESPVILAILLAAYTASNMLQHETGLATVTLMGIILANQKQVKIAHVVEFKENLGVLLLSVLFILLASRLRVDDLTNLGGEGLAFLAIMILIVRPLSILAATFGTPLNSGERLFLAWMAPRGIVAAAVTSVFALKLSLATNSADADRMVPLTFLVIVGTVTVYGLTAGPLARRLKIADPSPQGLLFAGADPVTIAIAKAVQEEGFVVHMIDANHENVAAARMAGVPATTASILSDFAREQIDLGGIGRLLAMTRNDQVNALAALEFTELFGRAGVYQLPPKSLDSARKETAAGSHFRGRYLFAPDATAPKLAERYRDGWIVKKTRLTEEFDFESFGQRYGASAVPLFYIGTTGDLNVITTERKATLRPGHLLIALVDPQQASA